jgi:hypothetical protein
MWSGRVAQQLFYTRAKVRRSGVKWSRLSDDFEKPPLSVEYLAASLATAQMRFKDCSLATLQLIIQIKSYLSADFLTLVHD